MARSDDSHRPDPDPADSLAARLRREYGEGVDPQISLGGDEASPGRPEQSAGGDQVSSGGDPSETPAGATNELLKRLAAHGVKSPRYKLEGEIARGGMGAILRVWDEDVRRHLAMKVILGKGDTAGEHGTPAVDAKTLARFLEEGQVTGQLDHPGIVPVHELGLDSDGRVYFTMKLVKGRDLRQIFELVFAGQENWNETRALGVVLKACEAIAYAHKKGVIHRDLKPANVMVGHYGEVYVMDWGLARVLGRKDTHDLRLRAEASSVLSAIQSERHEERDDAPDSPIVTMDGDVMGTPAYMPPEQARGEIEKLSARSDVYSIGALLYHLLARQMPYVPPGVRMTNRTVLARVLEGPPRPLHDVRREVPAELVALCEKAMAREPGQRYADTLALAEDLQAYLEHRVVRAYETGAVAELRKWVARNKGIAAASAAALLIGVLGLVWNSEIQRAARKDIEGKVQELRLTNLSLEEERQRANKEEEKAKLNERRALENEEHAKANETLAHRNELQALENEARAKRESYSVNLAAADESLRAGGVTEAKHRLDACDERLRGWEWRHLFLSTDTSLAVLRGHEGGVLSLAFSPDGTRIASGASGDTVRVWNLASPAEPLVLPGQHLDISTVAFSPDGSRIASAGQDPTIHMWRADTGEKLMDLPGHQGYVGSVAFSPDGSRIASAGGDRTVRVWSADSGKSLLVIPALGFVGSVAFSPDGSRIASAGGLIVGRGRTEVRVWDAVTGEALVVPREQAGDFTCVAFSPDGSRIASGSSTGTIQVWNASSGESLLRRPGPNSGISSVAFNPDGTRIALAPLDRTVRVWDAITGESMLVLHGHDEAVRSVAFSPDGSRIASTSNDKTIRVWSSTKIESSLLLQGHSEGVNSVAFSPDGSRIATGSADASVRLWNANSGENISLLTGGWGSITSVAYSPDGSRIAFASSDNAVRVWSATSPESPLVLRGHNGWIYSVAFSPDGSAIASASADMTVRVWDALSGEFLFNLVGHGEGVRVAAFSPDGSRIASASDDNTVRIWDANGPGPVLRLSGHQGGVQSVTYSPDGSRLASASLDGTVRIWDANSGKGLLELPGTDTWVDSVAFSPDGSRIVSASIDGIVRVWDSKTGRNLLVLRGHAGAVTSVVFSPDGARIASASSDKTVRVWETSASAVRDPARQIVAAATSLVMSLFERFAKADEVVEHLQSDASIKDDVRAVAIRLARLPQTNHGALNEASWIVVKQASGDPTAYARAASAARIACDQQPDNGLYLNTLGVAQYRLGQYEKALATLSRSDELNHREQPADAAFLAMANQQLGHVDAAQAELMHLRELMKDPKRASDAESLKFLEEAETLITGSTPAKPGAK